MQKGAQIVVCVEMVYEYEHCYLMSHCKTQLDLLLAAIGHLSFLQDEDI